jgi:hypothetical protein
MSTIPPNWLGSIIQAHGAQDRANKSKTDEAQASSDTTRDTRAEGSQNTIENSDSDSSVYADAEGAGSQGRAYSDADEVTDQDDAQNEETEQDGGLDVQA